MHCQRFLHESLLRISLLREELTLDTQSFLGHGRALVDFTSLLLALALEVVMAVAMELPVSLDVISLRHGGDWRRKTAVLVWPEESARKP